MNLFSKFFKKDSAAPQELNEQYNVMENITLETTQKYTDTSQFRLVKDNIYEDLNDGDETKYRMTVSYESDDDQYPLEDILDKFYLHVSDFLELENDPESRFFKRELAGELNDLVDAQTIIGRTVYNQDFLDGKDVRVRLVIE